MQPGTLVRNYLNLPMFSDPVNTAIPPIIPDVPALSRGIVLEEKRTGNYKWVRWLVNGHVGWSNADYVMKVGNDSRW